MRINFQSAFRHTAKIPGMALFYIMSPVGHAEQSDAGMPHFRQVMDHFRSHFGIVDIDCGKVPVAVFISINQIKGIFFRQPGRLFAGIVIHADHDDFADPVFGDGAEHVVRVVLGKDFDAVFSAGGFHHESGHDLARCGNMLPITEIQDDGDGVDVSGAGGGGKLVLNVTESRGSIEDAAARLFPHYLAAGMIAEHPGDTADRNPGFAGYVADRHLFDHCLEPLQINVYLTLSVILHHGRIKVKRIFQKNEKIFSRGTGNRREAPQISHHAM